MNSSFDLVAFLANDWSDFFRRYLFLSMARTNIDCKILCIQRPICFFTTPFLNRRKILDWFKKKQNLIEIFPNLFLYQPIVFLHDHLAPYVPTASIASHKFCPIFWQVDFCDNIHTYATSAKDSVLLITVSINRPYALRAFS